MKYIEYITRKLLIKISQEEVLPYKGQQKINRLAYAMLKTSAELLKPSILSDKFNAQNIDPEDMNFMDDILQEIYKTDNLSGR